jgi:aminoglycoside 3-N-acetyltransferase I
MGTPTIRRLTRGDAQQAREMFDVLTAAFGEPTEPLSDDYVDRLLSSTSFWAIAAFVDDRVVGGITAHTIPMTRSASAELFVYDLAVDAAFRRQGIGGLLVAELRARGAEAGVADVFVPADEDDAEAVTFYRSLAGRESPVILFAWNAASSADESSPHGPPR